MHTISFYSFKGGTGRTLLVANLATLAARLGMRVVMVDLDLEAPGLPYKFFPQPLDRPGVVEWLTAERRPALDEIVQPIALRSLFAPNGSLTLIPAGPTPSRDYLKGMLEMQRGPMAGNAQDAVVSLLMLRDAIRDELEPDLLLLDARTGITTTNAITTRVLADDVVALTLNTPEQRDGTRAVLRSLVPLNKPSDVTPLGLFVVVSRIPGRPADVGTYELTPAEEAAMRDISDFLTEPAVPLATTITDPRVLLLHNDVEVAGREQILLARDNALTSTALHIDYLSVAHALIGQRLTDRIDTAMAAVTDPDRRREWATFFARTDLILETKPARSEPHATLSDITERTTPADRVKILRALTFGDDTRRGDETRQPDLADALVDLAAAQRAAGEMADAIASLRSAAELYKMLAEGGSDRYLEQYVTTLNALSNYYSDAGENQEALTTARQAAATIDDARQGRPDLYRALAATTLATLGFRYGEAGDYGAGFEPLEDAVDLFRQLNEQEPVGAYRPSLASALNVLGMLNVRVGFTREAVTAAEQSVQLWRSLAAEDPARYQLDLARALNNLGEHLRIDGRLQAASNAISEAIVTYRQAAYTDPDRYLADLASALENLSELHRAAGRLNEAVTAIEEALHFRRDLLEADPVRYRLQLAAALNYAAAQYSAVERYAEALERAQEAVVLLRAMDNPTRTSWDLLAAVLTNLAFSYIRLPADKKTLNDRALPAATEALRLFQSIARPGIANDQRDIASALLILGLVDQLTGRGKEAVRTAQQAVEIYRQLVDGGDSRYTASLAETLDVLSRRQLAVNDVNAVANAQEAIEIYELLARDNSERYRPRLSGAAESLADALSQFDPKGDNAAFSSARELLDEL